MFVFTRDGFLSTGVGKGTLRNEVKDMRLLFSEIQVFNLRTRDCWINLSEKGSFISSNFIGYRLFYCLHVDISVQSPIFSNFVDAEWTNV